MVMQVDWGTFVPYCSDCGQCHHQNSGGCPPLSQTTVTAGETSGFDRNATLIRIEEMIEGLKELRDELQRKEGV